MSQDIFVSSPDLRPSLMSIVDGLLQRERLKGLVTTIGVSNVALKRLGHIPLLGKAISRRLQKRRIPSGLEDRIHRVWLRELMRATTNRFVSRQAGHHVWYWAECGFDRIVAKRHAGKVPILYGMEHSSLATFRQQRAAGGSAVLRMVNAHGDYLNKVILEQAEQFPEHVNDYYRLLMREAELSLERKRAEYALADYTIANSEFVRQTLIEGGVPSERVFAVPTGCPDLVAPAVRQTNTGVRFLFVGSLSLRKGFLYLLEAWRQLNAGNQVELIVAGQNELSLDTGDWESQGIQYKGVLHADAMKAEFAQADVFVLPTLAEGLSHSALEALSHGLPVITTDASGLGAFCVDGQNGLRVDCADVNSLAEAMQWAMDHHTKLADMGEVSRKIASQWTVSDSNRKHLEILEHIIMRAA